MKVECKVWGVGITETKRLFANEAKAVLVTVLEEIVRIEVAG